MHQFLFSLIFLFLTTTTIGQTLLCRKSQSRLFIPINNFDYNACKTRLELSLYEADEWKSKAVVCTVSIVMNHANAQMSIYFADENATEQVHVSNQL